MSDRNIPCLFVSSIQCLLQKMKITANHYGLRLAECIQVLQWLHLWHWNMKSFTILEQPILAVNMIRKQKTLIFIRNISSVRLRMPKLPNAVRLNYFYAVVRFINILFTQVKRFAHAMLMHHHKFNLICNKLHKLFKLANWKSLTFGSFFFICFASHLHEYIYESIYVTDGRNAWPM